MATTPALRRTSTAMAALALALGGAVALGSAASADVGPDQPDAPDEGTLTIWKYAGSPVEDPNDLDAEDLLDGVEFTVTQVGVMDGSECVALDLTDAADWDGLEDLFDSAPAAPAAPFCLTDTVQVKATDAGEAAFGLDVGIYFVQETDPGDNPIVSSVPNFYVSIPTSTGDGWNYDVVAHPKNQLMETPTKTISGDQAELVLGAEVTWTMTVPVPTLNNNETFTQAVITDDLDTRLNYVPGSSVVTVGSTPLDDGTDYNVTGNAVWEFTAAGRAVLDVNMGEEMTIEFATEVVEVGDGGIANDDYSSTFNGTEVPGEPEPYTYWGELEINKVDDSTPAKALKGAEFQVFPALEGVCADEAPTGGAIATGTSGADGVVLWGDAADATLGLWVANVDDGPADPLPSKDYCVYETVVPAGHTGGVIDNPVTITPGSGETGIFLEVENPKKDGPDLPLTGAQGTLAMTVVGLLLVGAGIGGVAIARRGNAG